MDQAPESSRRDLLAQATTACTIGGVALAYGTCGVMAARYLYPARPRTTAWQFVADVARVAVGESLAYRAPTGETVAIARRGDAGTVEDFVALSSTCPHLGCQVHWEPQNTRFFCPCHNGVFSPTGEPLEGPPADANQALARYPLRIEGGLLYIEVPMESLAAREERAGHDPCLDGRGELA